MMIDLHMHSACSDGTFSPSALMAEAKRRAITHVALTDHDTVAGLDEARRSARKVGLSFLGGVEISAEYGRGTMHILGYGFREDDPVLLENLETVQGARADRNPRIAEKLRELGMEVTLEEAAKLSGGGLVGRPHFARLLVQKGYVATTQEAFDRYLAKGRPAYQDKVRLSPERSIQVIRAAGGVAVLAHPLQLGLPDAETLEPVLKDLVEMGLEGLECYYRNHTRAQEIAFSLLAEKYGLLATGGSDFHGDNRPGIALGTGEGRMRVPPSCWSELAARLERKREAMAAG